METGRSTENLLALIEAAAAGVGVVLTPAQSAQLATHFRLLLRWNAKINLSAVREPAEIATRHFGESLFLSTLLPAPQGVVLDVGTGGGFPGLPLKVAWPLAGFVLLEPSQKKATFLREVIRQTQLSAVRVVEQRLDAFDVEANAGICSLITMRAVALDAHMLASFARLLQPRGQVALFLGEADAREVTSMEGWQWQEPRTIPHGERRVILIGSPLSGA